MKSTNNELYYSVFKIYISFFIEFLVRALDEITNL